MAVKCPECGHTHIWKAGLWPTKHGKKQRYKCADCGHAFLSKSAKRRKTV